MLSSTPTWVPPALITMRAQLCARGVSVEFPLASRPPHSPPSATLLFLPQFQQRRPTRLIGPTRLTPRRALPTGPTLTWYQRLLLMHLLRFLTASFSYVFHSQLVEYLYSQSIAELESRSSNQFGWTFSWALFLEFGNMDQCGYLGLDQMYKWRY